MQYVTDWFIEHVCRGLAIRRFCLILLIIFVPCCSLTTSVFFSYSCMWNKNKFVPFLRCDHSENWNSRFCKMVYIQSGEPDLYFCCYFSRFFGCVTNGCNYFWSGVIDVPLVWTKYFSFSFQMVPSGIRANGALVPLVLSFGELLTSSCCCEFHFTWSSLEIL